MTLALKYSEIVLEVLFLDRKSRETIVKSWFGIGKDSIRKKYQKVSIYS